MSQYTFGADRTLSPTTPATVAAGACPYAVAIDPSGRAAYVADNGGDAVLQFTIGPAGATGAPGASLNPLRIASRRWYEASQTGFSVALGATAPAAACFDGTNLWIASRGSSVAKVSPRDGAILATYAVPGDHLGCVIDGSSLWVPDYSGTTVTKVSLKDGSVVGSYAVQSNPQGLAFDGTYVWVANLNSGTVTKLKASDGSLVGHFNVGGQPWALEFDGANMWVVNGTSLLKLAADGTILATVGAGGGTGLAFDGANMWVMIQGGGLRKVRVSDATLIGSWNPGGFLTGLAFDGSAIWVSNYTGNSVMKFRATDGSQIGTFPVGSYPEGVAFDGESIWVMSVGSNTATKL